VIVVYPSICFSYYSKAPLKRIVHKMISFDGQIFLSAITAIGDEINAATS
jgi:hypothetical protein